MRNCHARREAEIALAAVAPVGEHPLHLAAQEAPQVDQVNPIEIQHAAGVVVRAAAVDQGQGGERPKGVRSHELFSQDVGRGTAFHETDHPLGVTPIGGLR